MGEGARGWVGSVVVHLAVVAAFLGASWWGSRQAAGLEPVDPLLVTLDGVPGRRPGEVGRKEGVARGSEQGSRLFRFQPIDHERLRRAEEQARSPSASGSAPSRARGATTAASGERVSLDEFNRGRGQGRGAAASGGVAGVSLGRATGTGDNGGDGGAASAQQLYAGEVLARFRDAWADLVAAEGDDLAGLVCGVRVSVSASGQVAFSGWLSRPDHAKAAALVQRAVARIGNCGTPPGGRAFTIDFTRVTAEDN